MCPRDFLRQIILPLKIIDSNLPKKGQVLDLGCGEGVIAKYLAKISTRSVIGVDADPKRLPNIKKDNLKFVTADIRKFKFAKADGVVVSDVLHHMNTSSQKKLLTNVNKNLKKNGVLIIKEIDTREFIRSRLSRLWDFLLYPKDKIFYWDSNVLKNYLKSSGYHVQVVRASRFFPGSTTVFICRK